MTFTRSSALKQRLAGPDWLMGDTYTIADIATFPWVHNLIGFYEAVDLASIVGFPHVTRACFLARPAGLKGLNIPLRT
jgi:GST-like protein